MAEEDYEGEADEGNRRSYFKSPLFRIIIGMSGKCYTSLPWVMRPLPVAKPDMEDIARRYGLKRSRGMEGEGGKEQGLWWLCWFDKVHGVRCQAAEYAVQWLALAEAYQVFAILMV